MEIDKTSESKVKLDKYGIGLLIGSFVGPLLQGAILFYCAGTIDPPRAWFFVALSLIGIFGGIAVVAVYDPELVNYRGAWKKRKDIKVWDRIVLYTFGIVGFYVVAAVSGYDVGRNQWPGIGISCSIIGAVVFIAGLALMHWCMLVNTHFETTVRIQTDREHKVITTGPYKIVRHPGYVGAILWLVSTPIIIGSVYGVIPAVIASGILVFRTSKEDKLLQKELEGYAEYAARVKYRLLPYVW